MATDDDTDTDDPPKDPEKIDIAGEVRKALGSLLGSATIEDEDGKDSPEGEKDEAKAKPRNVRGIEDDAESAVRKAIGKVEAEKEHQSQHDKIKEMAERAPVTVRKLTKWMWGEG